MSSVVDIKKKVEAFYREHDLANKNILLAVSGGKDSVTLLDVCYRIKDIFGTNLFVAHFDHNLRDSSKSDADFVEKLVREKYGLGFFRGLAELKDCSENTEAWARQKRYNFLKKVYKENDIDVIFTAHTGSDVAETLCMRLLSNKEPRNVYEIDKKRHLMRPLLSVLRKDISLYVRKNGLSYVEDPTNFDTSYLRNRVRHKLIPFLKENFNGNIESFLSYRGRLLEEDLSTLYDLAKIELKKVNNLEKFSKVWLKELRSILIQVPQSVAWRVAELIIHEELYYNVGKRVSLDILDLFFNKRIAVNLPEGKRILRSKGRIFIE